MSQPVHATDQDTGINASIYYSLTWPPRSGATSGRDRVQPLPFAIDSTSGQIKLVRSLFQLAFSDDENNGANEHDEYKLVIKASQTDNAVRVAYASLSIRVLLVNEHAPSFDSPSYEASVLENAQRDKIVCIVSAHDRDNNRVEFTLEQNKTDDTQNMSSSHPLPFSVDKTRGIVRVVDMLDFERQSVYELLVVANDGKRTTRAPLRVNVLNVVDEKPRFEHASYSFYARIPHDHYIGQVSDFI
jgi:hypothetical protein